MGNMVVKSLIKVFRVGALEIIALQGVSFEACSGQLVTINGPSGSGKTTLLNLIAGLDKPTAGSILVDSVSVEGLKGRELDRYLLSSVGVVFQSFNLISAFTALENVMFPMMLAGVARGEARARALQLLKRFGLEARASHDPTELSGGEQQRVAVAVALANDPPILVADEPTSELDSKTGEFLIEVLKEEAHARNKLVLVATHDERIVELGDFSLPIRDGKLEEVTRA